MFSDFVGDVHLLSSKCSSKLVLCILYIVPICLYGVFSTKHKIFNETHHLNSHFIIITCKDVNV